MTKVVGVRCRVEGGGAEIKFFCGAYMKNLCVLNQVCYVLSRVKSGFDNVLRHTVFYPLLMDFTNR